MSERTTVETTCSNGAAELPGNVREGIGRVDIAANRSGEAQVETRGYALDDEADHIEFHMSIGSVTTTISLPVDEAVGLASDIELIADQLDGDEP